MGTIWKVLTRKKAIDPVSAEETRLNRVLNTFDLTALGVGSTLGVGVYVLAGQVAKDTAGPSVVLSFLIATVASVFAGLCYAEFGARAPRAGSAYIYSYVCVGEFIAFVIGWNLILEYVIGAASVAKGLSLYLDTLINNTMQDTFKEIAPINIPFLSQYFDFFAFGISVLLAIALSFGLKESSMVNNVVTGLNLLVVLFVVVAGSLKADTSNWHILPNSTNSSDPSIHVGNGGFFPFGIEGMIKGAATCFYGFVGFDCIATSGEEVRNPRKAIPISIIVALFIIFLAYFGTATVLTLMVPYYLQDYNAPIPRAFEMVGWDWAKWIVAIGALFGLCASLFGAMFPLPRIIYAMGSDGLVFKFLAKVHPKFQTPVIGTILAGILTGFMGAIFNLGQLVKMMSIGTLLAYTIVAASVLLLRYKEEVKKVYVPINTSSDTESTSSESSDGEKYNDDDIRHNFDGPSSNDEQELIISNESVTFCKVLKFIFNFKSKEPNKITESIVAFEVFFYCILCICLGLCALYLKTPIAQGEVWAISLTSIFVGLALLIIISMLTQPTSKKELSFKVPFVPLIPALSILVNIYLMLMLDYNTWIRFAVWMAVGVPMYCICACTKQPQQKHHNGTHYQTNIINGTSKISNGISNPSFIHTDTNEAGAVKKNARKKVAAPLPPKLVDSDQKDNSEIQAEAVIAQLDEILDKEVAIAQLNDILTNETNTISDSDRKLSAGAMSDVSGVVSRSENVVADVHCYDVLTLTANPSKLSFPIVNDTFVVEAVNNPDKTETIPTFSVNDSDLNNSVLEPLFIDKNLEVDDSVSKVNGVKNSKHKKQSENLSHINEILAPEIEEQSKLPPQETVLEVKEECDTQANESIFSNLQTNEHIESIPPPPPPFYEVSEYSAQPQVKSKPSESSVDAPVVIASSVPTEEALKTVTLRHVKKEFKQAENENIILSEDNLKLGSEEYKKFVKSLDEKLKRATVIPTWYPMPKKDIIVPPKEVLSNDAVIEENINQEEAKEKLKIFLESKKESLRKENPRKLIKDDYRSQSVDERILRSTKLDLNDPELKSIVENNEDVMNIASKELSDENVKQDDNISPKLAFKEHKRKMENVFNGISSVKLRKLENKGDEHLKRRLSKSLGPGFAKEDDQTVHKRKMDDIFASINALRKDSFRKEINTVE